RGQAVDGLKRGVQELRGQAQLDLLWTLANVQLDADQIDEADKVIVQLRQAGGAPSSVDYLTARRFILQGHWSEGPRPLGRPRPPLDASPERARQAALFLGQCYEQRGEPARQLAVYRRVVAGDPLSVHARLRIVAARWANGQIDDAITEYREV